MPEDQVWRRSSYSGVNNNCVEVSMPHWRKSTYSGANENCLEVAQFSGATALRDSKAPDAATLTFSSAEWSALVRSACAGVL
ncbi:DUF397 domain-containing protein [Nocardiopsis mangrovi]|uniref:DUF397 domain-containing protein n=1 Tax=Nocardiopsis mangrovi TaxID=1179818 RepID=A0ABV9DVA8_9ACTN